MQIQQNSNHGSPGRQLGAIAPSGRRRVSDVEQLVGRLGIVGKLGLMFFEQAEQNLFEIDRELRAAHPELDLAAYICDICDAGRVRQIFEGPAFLSVTMGGSPARAELTI